MAVAHAVPQAVEGVVSFFRNCCGLSALEMPLKIDKITQEQACKRLYWELRLR